MASRGELEFYARHAAQNAGIDAEIFVRQIDEESGFNPSAYNASGASGIAQIVPAYHPNVDVWNPFASLDYAASLDAGYLRQFGSVELMLAAYNAGPGNVQKYGGVPPFQETQKYVRDILGQDWKTPAVPSLPAVPIVPAVVLPSAVTVTETIKKYPVQSALAGLVLVYLISTL